MSLYGALFSGVSGLTAQSSAMGAISDNITNVSTIGYKGTTVNFQTLVTKQTSSTFYSAGGVQSKPRQQTDVQGLLQASTSQTDIAISGGGFFVVNEANVPGVSDPYLFTRAGSFIQDDQGYLKNSQGYYLQGWPTDPAGVVIPANSALSVTNQNIISSDYLESINLNRVGGTAASTTSVAIGANLPASGTNSETGDTHKTDVEFFDSLGNANNMSVVYTKTAIGNNWDVSIAPPPQTAVATLYDTNSTPAVYASGGLIEFKAIPAAGSTIKIGFSTATARTYTFVNGAAGNDQIQVDGNRTLSQVVADIVSQVKARDQAFAVDTNRIHVKSGVTTAIEFTEGGVGDIYVDLSSTLNSTGAAVTYQTGSFTVKQQDNAYSDFTLLRFSTTLPADTDSIQINGKTYSIDMAGDNALPSATPTIKKGTAEVREITITGDVTAGETYTITSIDGVGPVSYTVQASDSTLTDIATGLVNAIKASGTVSARVTAAVSGTGTFTITATEAQRGRTIPPVLAAAPAGNTFSSAITTANVAPTAIATVGELMAAMELSIEGNDTVLATTGNRIQTFDLDNDGTKETLYIATVTNDANNVVTSGIAATAARPVDGDGTAYASTTIPVATASGIVFSSGGAPSAFNVGALEILGFADGAQDMNNATGQGKRITLDFGTLNEFNGLTQFGEEFTPAFITQNGSKFGTFAGVTIGQDGLVTALFDNGETRKIFQVPVATFVNPNQLENKSGNVWSATQFSGDYTLRVADSGPAGQVVQGTLESSTVDIGAEFTNMIVVQRAYSASTKIISTADAMLEELMRVKR